MGGNASAQQAETERKQLHEIYINLEDVVRSLKKEQDTTKDGAIRDLEQHLKDLRSEVGQLAIKNRTIRNLEQQLEAKQSELQDQNAIKDETIRELGQQLAAKNRELDMQNATIIELGTRIGILSQELEFAKLELTKSRQLANATKIRYLEQMPRTAELCSLIQQLKDDSASIAEHSKAIVSHTPCEKQGNAKSSEETCVDQNIPGFYTINL